VKHIGQTIQTVLKHLVGIEGVKVLSESSNRRMILESNALADVDCLQFLYFFFLFTNNFFMIALSLLILSKFVIVIPLQYLINFFHFGFYISSEFDELRPLVCQDSPREQLQQKLNLKYFLFTMEDMSTHSGNKLTERRNIKPKVKKIDQIMQRYNYHEFGKYQQRESYHKKVISEQKEEIKKLETINIRKT
jgi:hypothetical protein